MEADRGLDALIAQRVMGWKKHAKCEKCSVSPRHVYIRGEYAGDDWEGKECHPHLVDPAGHRVYTCECRERKRDYFLPRYSVDMADAQDVIKRLNELGFYVEISFHANSKYCRVQTWPTPLGETDENPALAMFTSFPVAVCWSALRAIERWRGDCVHDFFKFQVPTSDPCRPVFHQVCKKCRWDADKVMFMADRVWDGWAVPQLEKKDV
jgi:hypothetical protein